jgi:hypothetical protein|nr:MAG TPA: tail assembly protein [Caudoviricetes sp.]
MAYDIYLDRLLLPITPEKITISMKNKNEVISLINSAEMNILKTDGLRDITFKIVLPAYKYPFLNNLQGFNKPSYYLDKLKRLKDNRKPFQFIVSRQYPTGKKYFNTNIKVSLEEYTVSDDVTEFMDVTVDIKLKEYIDPRATVLTLLEDKVSGFITMPRPITKVIDRIYNTAAGETLWNVARGQLGGIEKMGKLMELNALNKLTDFIPGQKLRLK